MTSAVSTLVLKIDTQCYGLFASAVEAVIHLVDYCPLPQAPQIVIGVINYHDAVLPVVSLRRRFRHVDREPQLSDHLIIARTPRRRLALLADEACGLEAIASGDCTPVPQILPETDAIAGVAKRPDGFVLIHDLAACLAWDEERTLAAALEAMPAL